MSWHGEGAPVGYADGVATLFPHTDMGGREEVWEPEVDELWTTLDGDVITGDLRFRFRGSYTWSTLTNAQLELLVSWRNSRKQVLWKPHLDSGPYQMLCRVSSVEIEAGASVLAQNVVTVEIVALGLVGAIPIVDGRISGHRQTYMGVVA